MLKFNGRFHKSAQARHEMCNYKVYAVWAKNDGNRWYGTCYIKAF